MKYTDVAGATRTLTGHQREILLAVQRSAGGHFASPDPYASRLLEERGLVTRQTWHCPLDPVCITGLTPLGKQALSPRLQGSPEVDFIESLISHAAEEVAYFRKRGSRLGDYEQLAAAGRAEYAAELLDRIQDWAGAKAPKSRSK